MWSPLNVLTHYSPCIGLSKPESIIEKCAEYGYTSCAITDNCTLAGSVSFLEKAKKHNIKPIIGSRFEDTIVLAKNYKGWKHLIKMTSNGNMFDYEDDDSLIAIIPDKYYGSESGYNIEAIFGKNFYYQNQVGADKPCLYPNSDNKKDYRILLAADSGKSITELHSLPEENRKYLDGDFSLISKEESGTFSSEIIKNNRDIVEQCEIYNISNGLNLPVFPVPSNTTPYDYMVALARIGWNKKVKNKIPRDKEQEYIDRVKLELEVIKRVGLDGYFLIVQDYVNWAKNQRWLVGDGRGSSGGSLVCYLLNITNIDPIKYGLIFERFYNDGRNTKDRKALPDIDTDFPKFKRDLVIDYIKNKFGKDKVAQIATYHELKGKSSIKEVLRANDSVSNDEMNQITKDIPSKEEISDLLADSNESSILRWTLQNEPDILKNWVTMDDDGNIFGDLAPMFEQAIKLEGTIIGTGKHASGIVIAGEPLVECCPMMKDKDGEMIAAFNMSDLEKAGFVKFDILGVAALDKLMGVNNLLEYGKINVEETCLKD